MVPGNRLTHCNIIGRYRRNTAIKDKVVVITLAASNA